MVSQERDDERSSGEDEPMDKTDFKILSIIDKLHRDSDPAPEPRGSVASSDEV